MRDVLLHSTQVRILTKVVSILTSPKFGLKWFPLDEGEGKKVRFNFPIFQLSSGPEVNCRATDQYLWTRWTMYEQKRITEEDRKQAQNATSKMLGLRRWGLKCLKIQAQSCTIQEIPTQRLGNLWTEKKTMH